MKKYILWLMLTLTLLIAGCGAQRADVPLPKQETPVTETVPEPKPIPETPTQERPAEEVPEETAPGETAENTPAAEETSGIAVQQEPAEEIPAAEVPETPAQKVSHEQAPSVSAQNVPQKTAPDAPAQDVPADEIPGAPAEPPVSETASLTGQLPILMYHHVVPDGTECNDMTVTVSKLETDFQWLLEHSYTPILPRELVSGAPLPEKPVLITFDDGYRSNYELLFPLLKQYEMKAVISVMVYMQDLNVSSFLSWDMCREMTASGFVEIGSHAYRLHNLDERNGNFTQGGINGIRRRPEESDEDFRIRVLDDLQKSHDLLEEQLGTEVTFFAYPFGLREPDAEALIEELFPVTAVTLKGTADLADGTKNMPRFTVTVNTRLSSILKK